MTHLRLQMLLTTLLIFISGRGLSITYYSSATSRIFPVHGQIQSQVEFWEKVFYKYPQTTAIIHDQFQPNIIIDLIDFIKFAKQNGKGFYKRGDRDRIAEKYADRYRLALKRFYKVGKNAVKYGAIEKRIYDVYAVDQRALKRLLRGEAEVRVQTGLSDEFRAAAKRAHKYLPEIEKIFKKEGVPVDLSRLAFVESMFNYNAYSKVGASGMWQFMKSTAKSYLHLNHVVDERLSPIKSSRGAAKFLRDNYSYLKSWPLAITAYNHGPGGMKNASKRLKTSDLDTIVKYYKSNTFGFASRNFYSEFIAARNIYNRYYLPEREPKNSNLVDIKLKNRVSVHQLISYTPLNQSILKTNNPCIKKDAFGRHRYSYLPRDYVIKVPKSLASRVSGALKRIHNPKSRRGA